MNKKMMSLGKVGTNCYILDKDGLGIIIDPGSEAEKIQTYLTDKEIRPLAILLTHAHFDHIGAVDVLRDHFNVPVYVHQAEEDWLGNARLNGSQVLLGEDITICPADYFLREGNLDIGPFHMQVIHTPGHSPGSVSFIFTESEQIFSGDVLFYQGIGRTDLLGGNMDELLTTIRTRLFPLSNTFTVYPGHGVETTIGAEKQHNPFL